MKKLILDFSFLILFTASSALLAFSSFSFKYSSSFSSSNSDKGLESSITLPSRHLTILVEYLYAKSGLWVTIITNLSSAISLIKSIIWILVSVSNAPVGSSARSISGSFTKARAIATLWHWPPDNWLGFL